MCAKDENDICISRVLHTWHIRAGSSASLTLGSNACQFSLYIGRETGT